MSDKRDYGKSNGESNGKSTRATRDKGGKMKFTFYSDSGHGWLEVPYAMIKELGIEDQISGYSYVKDPLKVFLEEDCDAPVFIEAYTKKYGKMDIVEKYIDGECFIHELESYR